MQDKTTQAQSVLAQKRLRRNRNRSKRRAIFCKTHKCYLDSISPKYNLGISHGESQTQKTVCQGGLVEVSCLSPSVVEKEWLEKFWCSQCEQKRWYHIIETASRCYRVTFASDSLLQQASTLAEANDNLLSDDGFSEREHKDPTSQ